MTANRLVLIKTFSVVSFLASYRKFRKLLFSTNLWSHSWELHSGCK